MSKKNLSLNSIALTILNAVREKKATIPVLSKVLVTKDEGKLVAVATDIDIFAVAPVENLEPGLYDIVGTGSLAEFYPCDMAVKNFPDWKTNIELGRKGDFGSVRLSIPEIKRVLPAISREESRYTLNGAIFKQGAGNVVHFAATDGHRLTLEELNAAGTVKEGGRLVTRATLELIAKLAGKDDAVSLDFSGPVDHATGLVGFTISGVRFAARLLGGQFPNYEAVVPRQMNEQWSVDRKELLTALKALSPFLNSRSKSLAIIANENKLTLRATNDDHQTKSLDVKADIVKRESVGELGPLTVIMPMRIEVNEGIGFNAAYLLDAANHLASDRLYIGFKDAQSAISVTGKALAFAPEKPVLTEADLDAATIVNQIPHRSIAMKVAALRKAA